MAFRLTRFLEIYEKHLSSLVFIGGFILDNIMMRRVDLWWDDLLLIAYLSIAAASIIIVNLYDGGKVRTRVFEALHPWCMFAMQFSFGGLFSAFFIFYSRSATLVASWPFLLVLVVYMLSNEFARKHYARLSAQLAVFFTALFSFCIFFVPIVMHEIGDRIFLLSGTVALAIISVFIGVLSFVTPRDVWKSKKILVFSIGGIFLAINILYFTNIIPPIPLALKDVGVYTYVARNIDGTYTLEGDTKPWYYFFYSAQHISLAGNQPLYAYSAIFAPTKLNAYVTHVWQYYDEAQKKWVDSAKIDLAIVGGRDGGYRTYSIKSNLFRGKWRVNIETQSGQLVGRVKFDVD